MNKEEFKKKNEELDNSMLELLNILSKQAPTEQLSIPPKILSIELQTHKKTFDVCHIFTDTEDYDLTPIKTLLSLYQQLDIILDDIITKYKK